jgi:hypothetical protein
MVETGSSALRKNMLNRHHILAQPLGAGCADVVQLHHLQHARTSHAGNNGERNRAERKRRQDQMFQDIA